MPTERPLHGRYFIGRSLRSAAQAWGFRTLSLRETAWFYSVGLLTAAVLMWTPSQATPPRPDPSPTVTPAGRELSSEALAELPHIVRGFAEEGTIGEAESFVMNSRRTVPHLGVSRTDRNGRNPVRRATTFDIRSAARLAPGFTAQSRGDQGVKTPLLRADESVRPAPRPGDSPIRKAGNPRRRP